ncbi:MAG: hydantoinase B/oxoprolinase family protein [Pseudomonadota bacterium]|nr:hydantoinase B/oxoprolinase family protein [Pseudomonadota bacterium]MEC7573655.1 hydantoinase B/oxoprolinase family protein [Pseudomonadota bacterium]
MPNEATNSANASLDPITLEVLWTRLISTVDEAAAALVRTSFSTVVRDSHDFSCVITDASGRSLVQATDSIPSFIATLPATIKHFLDVYPADQLEPGDVLITNDIWMGTGHLPDISVGKPIFHNGKLVGFAGSTAHAPDIGGKIRSPEPREVFEEGFQIPIMKLMKAGEVDETFMRLLRQNVRAPDEVVGDLYAQLTALDLMERRVGDVMTQYELADLAPLASEIQDRSEKAMRAAIRELPDGTYTNEMPTDGLDVPVTLKVAVTIDGDEVRADYTGSSPQVGKAINCAMCYTYAMTVYAVKCAAAPDLPNNEGSVAPISAFAPERTIVNPLFPASGGSRALIGHFLPALIFGALAQVVPDRIMAGTGSPLWCINLAGVKPNGKPFANLFFFNGGMGATHRTDGQNCLSWPSNISSTPTEVIEQLSPMRIHRRGFRADSGGKGRYRGGLGQEVEFEFLNETPAALAMLAERTKTSAPGIAGGEAGGLGKLEINGVDVDPKAQHIVKQGDRLILATPGGGGYGNVVDRDDSDASRDKSLGYAGE